jgi:GNAT superfamily N-acetyltransferase
MNANPPIEYLPDAAVDAELDAQLRTLLSTCFTGSHNERFKTQRYFSEMPQHRWIIREPGAIVAHIAFHDKTIGTVVGDRAIVGLAEVAVHPDHRGQGLVKKMLGVAHADCAARGVKFAMLFGKQEVYGSSGYVQVLNPLHFYDAWKKEWTVQPVRYAMMKVLGDEPWPEGEIDLRGPVF